MEERRQIPRWTIKKEAKVTIALIQGVESCLVEDMHLKGMRFSFDKCLPQPESLRITYALEPDTLINVEAQITWMKEDQGRYVYGLSFSNVDDSDKDKITHYINTHCYDQYMQKWWAKP